jgi:membrane-associated phospholipid phosphatase
MSSLHGLEIDWIVSLQSMGDLRRVFRILSAIGQGSIPYLLPCIYLALSRSLGAQLYVLTSLDSCLLWLLKTVFHWPRPFWLDVRVKGWESAGYYGMPSGHVQGATCFWFLLASRLRCWWAWAVAFILLAMVGASRIYLGVHFISDVIGGFLVGAALVGLFCWAWRRFRPGWMQLRLWQQLSIVSLVTAGILALGWGPALLLPQAEPDSSAAGWRVAIRNLRPFLGPAGTFFATGCSLILAGRWLRFETSGPLWERALRCVFVLAGLELIGYGFSEIPTPHWRGWRLLLSGSKDVSIPIWGLLVAPWILQGASFLRPAGAETSVSDSAFFRRCAALRRLVAEPEDRQDTG